MNDADEHRIALRAGPLAMVFDTKTAFLRRIRAGKVEAIRGLYAAVRDHEWETIPAEVTLVEQTVEARSFRLVFDVAAKSADVDFRWRGTLTGDAAGVVRFGFEGRAHSSFLRNRIGFCLLHPADFAGTTCTVEHDDGTTEDVRIPPQVSPHQPVFDIRAITHRLDDLDSKIEVRFEGDVFEMEDQRNWTDASFKTYCTPLERPKPVQLHEGDLVHQTITVRLLGDAPSAVPGVYVSNETVRLRPDTSPSGTVPAVGAYFSGSRESVKFPFHHLRVDVDTGGKDRAGPSLRDRLLDAAAAAERLSASLFVSAMIGEADRLAQAAADLPVPISRWLVLREDGQATTREAVRSFRDAVDTGALVGGGSNAYFTEVNRMHPPEEQLDFVSFSVNPQVHAFDDLSIMETLPMHAVLCENARRITRGLPVVVSPITLQPRYNPQAAEPNRFDPGPGFDPRLKKPFGAAWTAGSFIYLCRAGAAAVTYHDVSTIGEPVGGLLRRILAWQGLPATSVTSSDAERVIALAVGSAPRSLLVVNLTPLDQRAALDDRALIDLPPYAYRILEDGL